MSMTTGQANAFNLIMRYLRGIAADPDAVLAALELLRKGAEKALMAGLREDDMPELWAYLTRLHDVAVELRADAQDTGSLPAVRYESYTRTERDNSPTQLT